VDGNVLVIGAGVAGMKASLLLAGAGRRVYLLEKTSIIGGRIIRCEDVYPGMECATCMLSPMQQEVLRNDLVDVITLGEILSLEGSRGDFRAKVRRRASSVDPSACIGCAECWNACPVETGNTFEENLATRKAISIPCAGALPNVPWIDRNICARWRNGEDCTLCADACVFDAVDFTMEDETMELEISHVVVATGFDTPPGDIFEKFRWGSSAGVFTAPEFERYFSSNGPTSGELLTKDGREPGSAAIVVHPLGTGGNPAIATMYSLKFIHYLEKKLPEVKPVVFLDASYSPDPVADRHHGAWEHVNARVVRYTSAPSVSDDDGTLHIECGTADGPFECRAELLVLGTVMRPPDDTVELAEILGIPTNGDGFFEKADPLSSTALTPVPGILLAGCAGGPVDVPNAVIGASAAAGRVLADSGESA